MHGLEAALNVTYKRQGRNRSGTVYLSTDRLVRLTTSPLKEEN